MHDEYWFSLSNSQLRFPQLFEYEQEIILGKRIVPSMVGDFFETLASYISGGKIIARLNGSYKGYRSADIIVGEKTLIEVKSLSSFRKDIKFTSEQLRNYHEVSEKGFTVIYYIFTYFLKRNFRLFWLKTPEKLFEYLSKNVQSLHILSHKNIWPLFEPEKIEKIWFGEIDWLRLNKETFNGQFRTKRFKNKRNKEMVIGEHEMRFKVHEFI